MRTPAIVLFLHALCFGQAMMHREPTLPSQVGLPGLAAHPSGVNNFTSRCNGINVEGGASSIVLCQSFDHPVTVNNNLGGSYFGVGLNGTSLFWVQDTNIKADGTSSWNALLPRHVASSAAFFQNFSPPPNFPTQFDAGQEFYFQYRERFDPGMLSETHFPNGGGWKMSIMREGDRPAYIASACQGGGSGSRLNGVDEIVINKVNPGTADPNHPEMYTACGNPPQAYMGGIYPPLQYGFGADPFYSEYLDQNAVGCPHYGNKGIPFSNCFEIDAGEFLTMQVHVRIGQKWGQCCSLIEWWGMHTGESASTLIDAAADWVLGNDNPGVSKYGKIWLTNYNTGAGDNLGNTGVWYDDLVVATHRLPDPDATTPNAPDSLSLTLASHSEIDVHWRVNSQNGTAQDDTGFKIERCETKSGDPGYCFAMQGRKEGFKQIGTAARGANVYKDVSVSRGHHYVYRVRATSVNGDSAYTAAMCFFTGHDPVQNPCGGQGTP